jgi:hypothetical protein
MGSIKAGNFLRFWLLHTQENILRTHRAEDWLGFGTGLNMVKKVIPAPTRN